MSTRVPRAVTLALAAALSVTACGGSDEPAGTTRASGSVEAGFPRTVEHAMGSTEIPERPERVVVLDTGELDSALALGVEPVGAVTTDVSETFLSYLAEDAEGIDVVGTIAEPDLEAIAALQPDLILSNEVRHQEIYDQLSQIAPTVFAADVGDTWKQNLLLDAEALGKEDEAERLLADYEQKAAELGEAIGDPGATTISPLRFVGGPIRAYQPQSFIGTVLRDIGLDLVELPGGDGATFAELSEEQLTQANGDVVLYSSYGSADESGEAAVVAGPLWSRLPAVQNGRAYAVDDDVFYTGIGLKAATLQLEQLEELLADWAPDAREGPSPRRGRGPRTSGQAGVSVVIWAARYCCPPTRSMAASCASNQSACFSSSRTISSNTDAVPWSPSSWHSLAEALNCATAAFSLSSASTSISSAVSPTRMAPRRCTFGCPSKSSTRWMRESASRISSMERS